MHARSKGLALLAAVTMGLLLVAAPAAAQDDDEDMATMAPQASVAPMASLAPGIVVEGAWTLLFTVAQFALCLFGFVRQPHDRGIGAALVFSAGLLSSTAVT